MVLILFSGGTSSPLAFMKVEKSLVPRKRLQDCWTVGRSNGWDMASQRNRSRMSTAPERRVGVKKLWGTVIN